MGIEIGSSGTGNGGVQVVRLRIPDREEYAIYSQGRRQLSLGLEEDSYAAFWGTRVDDSRFVEIVSSLGVPDTSEAELFTSMFRNKRLFKLGDLPFQLRRRWSTNYIRVYTPNLDFTWEGEGRRQKTRITGVDRE